MTKKEAVKECKKLWKEIEESGETKYGFLFDSPTGKKWIDKNYSGYCPLCEYATALHKRRRAAEPELKVCDVCPLVTQYGKKCVYLGFTDSGMSLPEWFEVVRGLR